MRVLIINTSELTGGAAVAANRLMDALNNNGVKAKMLVRDKITDDISVCQVSNSHLIGAIKFLWERLVIWTNNLFSKKNLFKVSTADAGFDISRLREFKEADIIHLHWINQGMLSLRTLQKIFRSGKPVVWTMHDMWECTAICHYAYECEAYKTECRNCPFLRLPGKHDLANRVFKKKKKILSTANIHFVAVSSWLRDCAKSSSLLGRFNISVIPNVLSLGNFTILDRQDERTFLGIKAPHVIAFGAYRIDDPIKGLNYLNKALNLLIETNRFKREELELILFGSVHDDKILQTIPVPYSYRGYVNEEQLRHIYSASDVVVSSSLYETFGQTLIEAMACGCTPVSFDNSGQTDIIDHKKNGYLATYLSPESLAEGIEWAIKENIPRKDIRKTVQRKFSNNVVAEKYIQLYNQLSNTKDD